MYNILTLNEISPLVNDILTDNYTVSSDCTAPEGILVRSFKMHDYEIPASLLAVARAGAGVNNIPLDKMTSAGVCVFNTPGANANAVKELVLTDMLISNRKIVDAIAWTNNLPGDDKVASAVEKGKKAFIGPELTGKTLGVVGLGAIGRMVANTAIDLGMNVLGYDPYINVDGAWSLHSNVKHVYKLDEIFANCDYITVHVPLTPDTKELVNKNSIATMKDGVRIINCARGELVNNADIIEACADGKVAKYITDFPTAELLNQKNIICIPHLGASTPEAEDNCAVMAANEIKDYLENGNIVNSVNFPRATSPRNTAGRITILHQNVSNMIAIATSFLSAKGINIANMVSASRDNIAYMIIDVDSNISDELANELSTQEGFIKVRVFNN